MHVTPYDTECCGIPQYPSEAENRGNGPNVDIGENKMQLLGAFRDPSLEREIALFRRLRMNPRAEVMFHLQDHRRHCRAVEPAALPGTVIAGDVPASGRVAFGCLILGEQIMHVRPPPSPLPAIV